MRRSSILAREAASAAGERCLYQSKIIKAGALLADTKTLFAQWDETCTVSENLARFRRENIFGKASRSRVQDILAIFRQRYLTAESVTKALATLVKGQIPAEGLIRIFYFHATQADALLHDVVTEILFPFHLQGKIEVSVDDIQTHLLRWVRKGKTSERWSEATITPELKVLEILGVERPWTRMAQEVGLLENSLRQQIQNVVARRNDIIHRGERPTGSPDSDPQSIDYPWTHSHIQAIRNVVLASDELVAQQIAALVPSDTLAEEQ